jgi:hypothetical protein
MTESDGKVKRIIETPFLAIPDAIARDDDLSSGAKLLFGTIFSLSMTARHCYAWNSNLARRIGLSVKQVKRLLIELERRGLIERRVDANQRSEIAVKWSGKPLKVRDKMSADKMSRSGGGSPKMSPPPPVPKCPQGGSPKMSPPHKRRISNQSERSSGIDCYKMSAATPPPEGSSPHGQDEIGTIIADLGGKFSGWRAVLAHVESVAAVQGEITTAGFVSHIEPDGKIELGLPDGVKPDRAQRLAILELGRRLRVAWEAEKQAETDSQAKSVAR